MQNQTKEQQMFNSMCAIQAELQAQMHPEWCNQNWQYDEAIIAEAGELMESLGFKWWKHGTADVENAKVELVDIWHFMLNGFIENELIHDEKYTITIDDSLAAATSEVARRANHGEDHLTACRNILRLFLSFGLTYNWSIPMFFEMWFSLNGTYEELYQRYIAKNALNRFRQMNGYKDGTYRKIWNGQEDNVYAMDMAATAPIENAIDYMLKQLSIIYKAIA